MTPRTRQACILMAVPTVDFAALSLSQADSSIDWNSSDVRGLCEKLDEAFRTIGFVFLTNFGVPEDEVEKIFTMYDKFFDLPVDVKNRFRRAEKASGNNGYVALRRERLDPTKPSDLKETFQTDLSAHEWPDKEVPTLKEESTKFFGSCRDLGTRVMAAMGRGLDGLKDPDLFVNSHQLIGSLKNRTTLRVLHYPPLPPENEIEPGQLRCGEHSDYGSITLLFQDTMGGLQVKKTAGGYINVPYVRGAVLVNLGSLMQQWTSDKYIAARHRVLLPEDPDKRSRIRRSIAFFFHPDDDFVIESLDGSNKYEPITAGEFIDRKFAITY
ncbi:uncharacterized protein [Oscarella lobularis]|uniref:uncharacterized protein n=1 Tax=Oscarella lobularis TaxID=121494 RepID=UPI003313E360